MTDVPTRDQPLIAIDVVPFSFTGAGGLEVATSLREFDPFAGQYALPGVLLGAAESLADASRRALKTKAGISSTQTRHLLQIGAFDRPGRDPRSHAISIAFLAVVADGAGSKRTAWDEAHESRSGMPFDHDQIIATALEEARNRLWSDSGFTRALLGPTFSTPEALTLTEALTGKRPHHGNFHRDLSSDARVAKVDRTVDGARGRPANLWRWID
jgi:ADP-ribose pyrophosphatase YjhB (NUDIX family)